MTRILSIPQHRLQIDFQTTKNIVLLFKNDYQQQEFYQLLLENLHRQTAVFIQDNDEHLLPFAIGKEHYDLEVTKTISKNFAYKRIATPVRQQFAHILKPLDLNTKVAKLTPFDNARTRILYAMLQPPLVFVENLYGSLNSSEIERLNEFMTKMEHFYQTKIIITTCKLSDGVYADNLFVMNETAKILPVKISCEN